MDWKPERAADSTDYPIFYQSMAQREIQPRFPAQSPHAKEDIKTECEQISPPVTYDY
jgi:hypothetical protein